jgi:hypothetical protein
MMTHIPDTSACPLSRKTPYSFKDVSNTGLALAQIYGGCNYMGQTYTYFPDTDELVRDDVLRWAKRKPKTAPANNERTLL